MIRRIVAVVAAVAALGLAVPGGAAHGQAPEVPGSPYDVTVRAADGRAHVVWRIPGTPPTGSTGGVVRFDVTPWVGRTALPSTRVSGWCCSGSALVFGLQNGTAHRFTVTASNEAGSSAPSARSAAVRPQPWGPYADPDRLTREIHRLFAFRRPTTTELAAWRRAMEDGTARAADLVLDLVEDGAWDDVVGAVMRFYGLALHRNVDLGAIHYWRDELRSGRRTLSGVARAIGLSREVAGQDGEPDAEWVRNGYRHVTGRWPTPVDQAFWEGQLARGVPRWKVALLLSETAENVRRTRDQTGYYSLYAGFDDRVPTADESWSDLIFLAEGRLTLETMVDEQLLGAGVARGPAI